MSMRLVRKQRYISILGVRVHRRQSMAAVSRPQRSRPFRQSEGSPFRTLREKGDPSARSKKRGLLGMTPRDSDFNFRSRGDQSSMLPNAATGFHFAHFSI